MIGETTDIKEALADCKPGDIVIFDIDDTVSRVPQTIGLDAWFRFTLSRYIEAHDDVDKASFLAISLYNEIQHATIKSVPVDADVNIASEIRALKAKGVKVIALTSRNHAIIEPTQRQLASLNIEFDKDVLKEVSFTLKGRRVEIKDGIIFSNGCHKGEALRRAAIAFKDKALTDYAKVHFIDDGKKHCVGVEALLSNLSVSHAVWHYQYAMFFHPFDDAKRKIADRQEAHWKKHGELLKDSDAIAHYRLELS